MRGFFLMLCVCVTACVSDPEPWFTWDVGTRPNAILADGSTSAEWTREVDEAHLKWSVPLAAMGCEDPFRGENSADVVLIPNNEWYEPGAIGLTYSDHMDIEGTVETMAKSEGYKTTLPHELGHALGLEHIFDDSDPESVMHTPNSNMYPSAKDIEHVAHNIGCR